MKINDLSHANLPKIKLVVKQTRFSDEIKTQIHEYISSKLSGDIPNKGWTVGYSKEPGKFFLDNNGVYTPLLGSFKEIKWTVGMLSGLPGFDQANFLVVVPSQQMGLMYTKHVYFRWALLEMILGPGGFIDTDKKIHTTQDMTDQIYTSAEQSCATGPGTQYNIANRNIFRDSDNLHIFLTGSISDVQHLVYLVLVALKYRYDRHAPMSIDMVNILKQLDLFPGNTVISPRLCRALKFVLDAGAKAIESGTLNKETIQEAFVLRMLGYSIPIIDTP